MLKSLAAQDFSDELWRRRWDSNPRATSMTTAFRVVSNEVSLRFSGCFSVSLGEVKMAVQWGFEGCGAYGQRLRGKC